jgi:UDP:flavonoid glycosyltransferase YjiC (YdhE family)
VRVLFATTRGAGHLGPLVPLAEACVRRGHEVLVAGPASAAPLATRSRLPYRSVPEPPPRQRAEAYAPVWSRTASPGAEYVIRELFVALQARSALFGMVATVAEWRPDVIVRESCEFASMVAAERFGIPQVQFGIHLSAQIDADELFLAVASTAVDELRALVGVAPDPGAERARRVPIFTHAPHSLDDPAASVSDRVRRFRHPGEPAPARERVQGSPLVYVSFGSEAPASGHFPGVYRGTVQALAELPVRVLVTIGDRRHPAELRPLPPRVRIERWVSQPAVMRQAAAMVGHGGSGSTLIALAAGVPLALIPLFVDGPLNARRVQEIGAGFALDDPGEVTDAVRALLEHRRYRRAAERVAAEIRALPPLDDAVDALVALAAEKRLAA